MRKLDGRGLTYGTGAFLLEATGVASGAYTYGNFPLKICGVPLCIPFVWLIMAYLAYLLFESCGAIGIFLAYLIDLILEPLAAEYGLWTWLKTFTAQIYFGSTFGNVIVWILMLVIGVYLFKGRNAK